MGREVKRVPLDFYWPINVVWEGYINHFYKAKVDCKHCNGNGNSEEAERLSNKWYGYGSFKPEDRGSVPYKPTDEIIRDRARKNVPQSTVFFGTGPVAIDREAQRLCDLFNSQWSHHLNKDDVAALLEEGRLSDLTHDWSRENGWVEKTPKHIPTPQEVNEWSITSMMGHDCLNKWICIQAECKRLGVENYCSHCKGDGYTWPSNEAKEAYDNWKETPPPKGEGLQLWETTSEGSPISPVFATPEELAHYMANCPERAKSIDAGITEEEWLQFIRSECTAPSMVISNGKIETGVKYVASNQPSAVSKKDNETIK